MRPILFLSLILFVLFKFAPDAEQGVLSTSIANTWSVADSKAYAQGQLQDWQYKQWTCLSSLWGKESAWNPRAYNRVRVMGKHAGGIPQLLGLDPKTPPTYQIDRGLSYIYYRYGTPCHAWKYWKKNGWY